MKLKAIRRSSLVNDVVERLREIIERGELLAGDRLPSESELVEQLGVSRTALREAVGRLETIGVLKVERGRGMFVGDRSSLTSCAKLVRSAMAVSPKELLKYLEFRSAIEYYAVRHVAQSATRVQSDELAELCDQIDRQEHDDVEAIHRDLRFHLRLVELTGNELMRNVMEVIQEFAVASMVQTTPRPRDRRESRQRHLAIVKAIQSRDPAAAEAAMRKHMARTRARLEELIA